MTTAPDKTDIAQALAQVVAGCQRCGLHRGRKQAVFGVGDLNSPLLFIGEAPGADEDEQGEPFVGRSGQFLTKLIEKMGLTRADVYIANVVKCRPPGNRDPSPAELEHCSEYLLSQISLINPRIIATLGRFSLAAMLGEGQKISQMHGKIIRQEDRLFMPMYHPAYALRNPQGKDEMVQDFSKLRALLKKLELYPGKIG